MESVRHIFIDESGDTSIEFEKKGVSNYYVLVAVIVDDLSVKSVNAAAERISKYRFGGAEIKSSRVGGSLNRRRRILSELSVINFKYYAYIVNKKDIYKDSGLQYKRSFYKYINGNLYERLFRSNQPIKIHSDKHGRSNFMGSFERYVKNRYKLPLFQSNLFEYVDSKNSHLVQIADFIAGTLSRCLDGKDPIDILKVLEVNKLFTYRWPPSISRGKDFKYLEESERYDQVVKEQSVEQAKKFIFEYVQSFDPDTQMKVKTLEYLLHRFFLDPEEYVYSDEIIEYLSMIGFDGIKKQHLRSGIVAPLRDGGVVIASCNKGYKIPNGTVDMHEFVKTVDGVVVPYVQRLSAAREIMMLASGGDYDIVSSADFLILMSYLKSSEYS